MAILFGRLVDFDFLKGSIVGCLSLAEDFSETVVKGLPVPSSVLYVSLPESGDLELPDPHPLGIGGRGPTGAGPGSVGCRVFVGQVTWASIRTLEDVSEVDPSATTTQGELCGVDLFSSTVDPGPDDLGLEVPCFDSCPEVMLRKEE